MKVTVHDTPAFTNIDLRMRKYFREKSSCDEGREVKESEHNNEGEKLVSINNKKTTKKVNKIETLLKGNPERQ